MYRRFVAVSAYRSSGILLVSLLTFGTADGKTEVLFLVFPLYSERPSPTSVKTVPAPDITVMFSSRISADVTQSLKEISTQFLFFETQEGDSSVEFSFLSLESS